MFKEQFIKNKAEYAKKINDRINTLLGKLGGEPSVPAPPLPGNINKPNYTIRCYVGSIDLSNTILKISMVNSIRSVYSIFFLEFKVNSSEVSNEDLYGQELVTLEITLTDDSASPIEDNKFELFIVDIKQPLTPLAQDPKLNASNEGYLKIIAIPKVPFVTMSTPVNFIMDPLSKNTGVSINKKIKFNLEKFGKLNLDSLNKMFDNMSGVIGDTLGKITDIQNNITGVLNDSIGSVNNIVSSITDVGNISLDSFNSITRELDGIASNINNSVNQITNTKNTIKETFNSELTAIKNISSTSLSFEAGHIDILNNATLNVDTNLNGFVSDISTISSSFVDTRDSLSSITDSIISLPDSIYKSAITDQISSITDTINISTYSINSITSDIGSLKTTFTSSIDNIINTNEISNTLTNAVEGFSDTATNIATNIGDTFTQFSSPENILNTLGVTNLVDKNIGQLLSAVDKVNSIGGAFGNLGEKLKFMPKTQNKKRKSFDVAENAIKQFLPPEVKMHIMSDNSIEDILENVIIPPRTLCGAIRYIEDIYGLFTGPAFNFCRWEENTYCLWDLSKATEMPEDYTIHFLPLGADNSDIIKESSTEEGVYYTYNSFNYKNASNKNILEGGYNQVYIRKNLHNFVEVSESDITDISNLGVGDGTKKDLTFSEILSTRKRVFTDSAIGGPENSENNGPKNKLTGLMAGSATLSFYLSGFNYPITRLSRVGGSILIKPYVQEYLPYQGKYCIASSILCLSRDENLNFKIEALVKCFRQTAITS